MTLKDQWPAAAYAASLLISTIALILVYSPNDMDIWPITWEALHLVPAKAPSSGSIFSLAEYLSALALLLVIFTVSDFRFRYRLALPRANLIKIGGWVAISIGLALLIVDVWFANSWLLPSFLNSSANIKAVLGGIFISFVFVIITNSFIRPPTFSKRNALTFFEATAHFIHEGNEDRLQAIAEELSRSIDRIVLHASKVNPRWEREVEKGERKLPIEQAAANDLLLLLGDRRFCRVVVEKVPTFAVLCFQEMQKYPDARMPITHFARNIGQEFIRNTNSAFYQEESGYYSGYFGYLKPVTNVVYGSYKFIEACASDGASPLETDFEELYDFDKSRIEGYTRASLAFVESYIKATNGELHSYAFFRMLHSFEGALSGVHRLNGTEDLWRTKEYQRLRVTVRFINDAVKLIEKYGKPPRRFKKQERERNSALDRMAALIFETILAASSVTAPVSTCWMVQHNTVWADLFSFDESKAMKVVKLKVRRLLYEEIKRMDKFVNFKGARVLGYCLNVLGLNLEDRHRGYQKEFYPLHAAALSWTKRNFRRLLDEYPDVAATCLHGSITYDEQHHRLVKTYSGNRRKEPPRTYLDLD